MLQFEIGPFRSISLRSVQRFKGGEGISQADIWIV